MSYWDTACLIKIYVDESDSALFRDYLDERDQAAVTGEFTRLEFLTTVWRKEADGEIAEGWAQRNLDDFDESIIAGTCRLVAVGDEVRREFERVVKRCFAQTPPVFIRTLDALHIAAANTAGETEIVATDKRLREAAGLLGFAVFPA